MSFQALGLSAPILKVIANQKYTAPFPIQSEAIPAILAGKDLLALAKTGSGKTASYVLPILEGFQLKKTDRSLHLKVLILVPTRELAVQVNEVMTQFSADLPHPPKSLPVFGGVPVNQQMLKLKNTEVLIATPGRLLDLIASKSVHLGKIETLVLDEADKLLDLGFEEEIQIILKMLPKKRQNILFSATLDTQLDLLKNNWLNQPLKIEIAEQAEDIDQISQRAYISKLDRKGPLLRYLIKTQKMTQVLVFTSSVRTADNVVEKLKKNGILASAFHSKKTQGGRLQALQDFKTNRITVLVATDLAARGIDIEALPWVINYELPRSPKDYIHRIGRTGRASASGTAITIICPEDEHHFYIIQKKMGTKIEKIDTSDFDLTKY
jgi:ATP-dependent RNA helicase RhlE